MPRSLSQNPDESYPGDAILRSATGKASQKSPLFRKLPLVRAMLDRESRPGMDRVTASYASDA